MNWGGICAGATLLVLACSSPPWGALIVACIVGVFYRWSKR